MTTRQPMPDGAVLVAIDVAKHRNEILIEAPASLRRRRLTILNTREEHDRLVGALTGYEPPVVVGFEATGNYHRPLAHRLLEAGLELRLISSLALARTRQALTNGWDKNDPKDAQVILHMLRIGAVQHYHDPLAHGLLDLQELSKTHEMVSRAKTELWHRLLTHYLPLYFPEAERFRGNTRSDWFLALLEAFPTPSSITAMSKEEFITAAWSLVGRKVSKRCLLADIYETASNSIGLPIGPDSDAVALVGGQPHRGRPGSSSLRMTLAEGRSLIRQRDEIERRAELMLAEDTDYRRLRTIPGLGPINVLTILAEAGDLRRFAHHRQFLKFCGLDLATHQSGTFRGQTKLSKFGNARLRKTFWLAAQVATRQRDNSFRTKFERYIAPDRNSPDRRRKALTAIAAKMARTAHAIVKGGVDYRPFFEGAVPGGRTPLG
jgi:transposase